MARILWLSDNGPLQRELNRMGEHFQDQDIDYRVLLGNASVSDVRVAITEYGATHVVFPLSKAPIVLPLIHMAGEGEIVSPPEFCLNKGNGRFVSARSSSESSLGVIR